jgi:acyl-coenzyme A thioesterase PaaI-like protein
MNTDLFMDTRCFACGRDNDRGLHLDIQPSHGGVEAEFMIPPWCQGYQEIVHGGIVSTILDELMVWAAYRAGHKCVTAELSVRIKWPMRVGVDYRGYGSIDKQRHRFVQAYARIYDKNTRIHAYGQAKLMRMT